MVDQHEPEWNDRRWWRFKFILIARNLWESTVVSVVSHCCFQSLEALNIDLRVFRGRRLLYTATTWAGYIGVLTAQRPGSYAAAVNFREANGDAGSTGGTTEALPVGLAVRLALERNETYGDFVEEMWLCYTLLLGAME